MNDINQIDPLATLRRDDPSNQISKKKELGQEDFMKILVSQIQNQNPLDPQDSKEFISQLATFGMQDGINNLQKSFEQLSESISSSQAVQASALVGRSVQAPIDKGLLSAQGQLRGSVELPQSTGHLMVSIFNDKNELQHKMDLGAQQSGRVPFAWDGKKDDGTQAAPGYYRVKAETVDQDKTNGVPTLMYANIDSITLDKERGVILNLAGYGDLPFSEVRTISQ